MSVKELNPAKKNPCAVCLSNSFAVYPNPAANLFNIEFTSSQPCGLLRLEVRNALGQTIFYKTYAPCTSELNETISDIAKGVYFVIVHSGNERLTKKVVIQ